MHLSYSSISPYFFIVTLIILIGVIFAKRHPFYAKLAEVQEKGRYEALDGLRGLLAFGVFFQHAVTNYAFFQTGVWVITPISFYRHAGGEAVILFFMMTSFLFWSKAIAKKGEVNMISLYKNRILRLVPMYVFSAGLVVLSALIITRFHISNFAHFARDIVSWLTMGLITTTSTNGLNTVQINAGIHWTLHFEWIFYLLLPVTAIVLRSPLMRFLVIPYVAIVALNPQRGYWVIFLFGIIAAHVVHKFPNIKFFKNPLASLVPLLGVWIVYMMQHEPYSVAQYCVTFFVFISFVYGTNLFGLLETKALKFLGTISYSVYLLHGIILFAFLTTVNIWYPISMISPVIFWMVVALCAVLTVMISAFTYQYVEYPFLKKMRAEREKEKPKANHKLPMGQGSSVVADTVM